MFIIAMAFLPFIGLAQDEEVAPKIINYQGKLTDALSQPLGGDAGGTFRLRFEIFPHATEGNAVWAEERDAVVIGGIFNVALGGAGGDAVGATPNDLALAFVGPEGFLSTTIVSGPGIAAEQTLAPRQQLASTPYALVAQTAERAAVASLAESLIPELMKALNPPGTIIAYGGAVTDPGGRPIVEPVPGYLLCNGAVIDDVLEDGKYADLKAVLSTRWGNGQDGDSETVNLPDLRGVFLRGWSGAASDGFVDEDRYSEGIRVARLSGGATANAVGSFQQDEFQEHSHKRRYYQGAGGGDGTPYVYGSYGPTGLTSSSLEGESETRPKNAYVAYLIKY